MTRAVFTFLIMGSVARFASAQTAVDFARDVAPIFEKHCLRCHKTDSEISDLSLQTPNDLRDGGYIAAGKREAGHLISIVSSVDGERPRMPKKGRPLSTRQIATLKQWINDGAKWPDELELPRLWSLQPVVLPPVPEVDESAAKPASTHIAGPTDAADACENPIDRFVLRRLHEAGLHRSPPAAREILIRRLKFDLLGLPPTAEEIDEFTGDPRPDAWEYLVDRYLAEPAYGERWAQHWLDVARFSESNGFEQDEPRPHAWPYRDYVIRSLNADKPYDQFVREQIAGDVQPDVTHDSIIATGFLVAGPFDIAAAVSASPVEQLRAREVQLEEMLATVSQVFLGLTVNCARCHNHKYDPIPQTDYYRLKAVFEGVDQAEGRNRPARRILTPDEEVDLALQRRPFQSEISRLEAALRATEAELAAIDDGDNLPPLNRAVGLWHFDKDKPDSDGRTARDLKGGQSNIAAQGTARFGVPAASGIHAVNSNGRVLDSGAGVLRRNVDNGGGYAIIPSLDGSELLPLAGTPMSVFARVRYSGEFNGTEDVFRIGDRGDQNRDTCGFEILTDGDGRKTARARFVVTGKDAAAEVGVVLPTALEPDRWYDLAGVFKPDDDATGEGLLTFHVHDPATGRSIAEPVSMTVPFDSLRADGHQNLLFFVAPSFRNGTQPNAQLELAAIWHAALTADDARILSSVVPASDSAQDAKHAAESKRRRAELSSEIVSLKTELTEKQKELKTLDDAALMAYVGVRREPAQTVVFNRGDIRNPGDIVEPAGLSSILQPAAELNLSAGYDEGERRLRYAEWVTDPRNPLTARVIVNRVWLHHFGTGLVDTPSDFGTNGGQPSHPELLNWLTARFIADGWSLKKLHRLMLTSAAWKQSSRQDVDRDSRSQIDALLLPFENPYDRDSDNRLLWRFTPRRLDAETVRDSMLAISGELNSQIGGAGFQPFTTTQFNTYFYHLKDTGEAAFNRRTVYRMKINTGRDPLLDALDCPSPSVMTPERRRTVTPLQSLALMNDTFVLRQADRMAKRIRRDVPDLEAHVSTAWRRAFGRLPTAEESSHAAELIDQADLATLCWVLLNSSEFLTVR